MQFEVVGRIIVPSPLAAVVRALANDGVSFNTGYRGEDAKALLHSVGQHTQYELYHATPAQRKAWGLPAVGGVNPPGFSQHELRNSAGQPLQYWQLGLDVANADRAILEARNHGWTLYRPYTTESWHVQFTQEPHIMQAFIEGADTIGQNLNLLINMAYWNDGTRVIGSYTTRTYAASAEQWARVKNPLKIDQAPTNEMGGGAIVKDVESGAASIRNAVACEELGHPMMVYLPHLQNGFSLAECRAAMSGHKNVRYWVADWRYNRAQAIDFMYSQPDVLGVQWASPDSNPNTMLPGSNLTLKQSNVDLSVWRPNWKQLMTGKPAETSPKGVWHAEITYRPTPTGASWDVQGTPGENVSMGSEDQWDRTEISVNRHTGQWQHKSLPR